MIRLLVKLIRLSVKLIRLSVKLVGLPIKLVSSKSNGSDLFKMALLSGHKVLGD